MAAPSFLYKNRLVSSKTGMTDKVINTTSSSESAVTLLDRFYLDGFVHRLRNGERTWSGYCFIGSPNYYMHNIARLGWLHEVINGREAVVFWDAGLNTLGYARILLVPYKWANNFLLDPLYRSAWYVDSSNLGVRIKKSNESNWTVIMFNEFLAQKEIENKERHIYPTFNYLDEVDVQPILENEEGIYYGDTLTFTVDTEVFQQGAYLRQLPCDSSSQVPVDVWYKMEQWANLPNVTTGDANTGIYLYKDVKMDTPVDRGWYFGLDGNKSFFVNNSGEIRQYDTCEGGGGNIVRLAPERDIDGGVRFRAFRPGLAPEMTVTARIDIGQQITVHAKYIDILIPVGAASASESITRYLDRDDYQVYDAQNSSGLPMLVSQL